MPNFEEMGRTLDRELERLRKVAESKVKPATCEKAARRPAQRLRQPFTSGRTDRIEGHAEEILLARSRVFLSSFCARCWPVSAVAAGTAGPRACGAAPVPGAYVEQGIASWYGVPFHGRRAANGEVYDMNQPTAAHRTLPFGSMVRVTNLDNGRKTEVRITDRGPFVEGRIIDLSFAAARSVDMVGAGIARVRLDLLSSGRVPSGAGNFTVQVGAFTQRGNAERLRDQLMARYEPDLHSGL